MKSSTRDKTEGKMHQVKGKIKETVEFRKRLGTSRKFWANK